MSEDLCTFRGCVRPADEWSLYCSEHQVTGPSVGAGGSGPFSHSQVGDEVLIPSTVGLDTYVREWEERSIRWSEAAELAAGVLDQWDPDHSLSVPQRVELFQWMRQWLARVPDLLPREVAVDDAASSALTENRQDYELAALWFNDTLFFGAGALVRDLVPLLVIPAISLVGGAPAAATLAAAAVGIAAAWKSLTGHRIELDDANEIRVFNAVHEASWELVPGSKGTWIPVRRGAHDDQLYAYLKPWLSIKAVDDVLRRLSDRQVLERARGRWTIVS